MHIFLTGDIQVGKTTIIRKFLSKSRLPADGFMTYWEPDNDGGRSLYISPYSLNSQPVEKYLIARDDGNQRLSLENMAVTFDMRGSGILQDSGKRDIIIMDELGFLESNAEIFKRAVMRHIGGAVPILGVIRSRRTAFLDLIRAHPGVKVCEVTAENREAVLNWLLENI